jgi:hypothetical protein
MAEQVAKFEAILAVEPQLTRAALARRQGVSRTWITRVLGSNRAE